MIERDVTTVIIKMNNRHQKGGLLVDKAQTQTIRTIFVGQQVRE